MAADRLRCGGHLSDRPNSDAPTPSLIHHSNEKAVIRSRLVGGTLIGPAGRCVRLDPGTTKNGEGRSFPFTADIETILKGQLAEHERLKAAGTICPFVFHRDGERIREFRTAWKNACKAAGCPGNLIHDMRRSAVRTFERAGVPRSVAMSIVGHKTESIYRRYAIVDEAMQQEAAALLDAYNGAPKPTRRAGSVRSLRRASQAPASSRMTP